MNLINAKRLLCKPFAVRLSVVNRALKSKFCGRASRCNYINLINAQAIALKSPTYYCKACLEDACCLPCAREGGHRRLMDGLVIYYVVLFRALRVIVGLIIRYVEQSATATLL